MEHTYKKCKEDNADIVVFQVMEYDNRTGKTKYMHWAYKEEYIPKQIPFSYKDMPKYIFNSFQNWVWNKLFSAEFIRKHNIKFQEIKRTNDLLFTCSALVKVERITLLEEKLVYYRINHGGICQATNNKAPLDFYKAFCALKQYLIIQGMYAKVQQSFVNWALDGCLYNLGSIKDEKSKEIVYQKLKQEGFHALDIDRFPESYFYDNKSYQEYKQIMGLSSVKNILVRKVWGYYKQHGIKQTVKKIMQKLNIR